MLEVIFYDNIDRSRRPEECPKRKTCCKLSLIVVVQGGNRIVHELFYRLSDFKLFYIMHYTYLTPKILGNVLVLKNYINRN